MGQNHEQEMWNFLQANKTVSAEDLQKVAGVTQKRACDWLQALTRLRVVAACAGGKWRLIEEPPRSDRKGKG